MNWEKTDDTTLESVPRRYKITSHKIGYCKTYIAEDTIGDGAFAARRGIHMSKKALLISALSELKTEVELYDAIF